MNPWHKNPLLLGLLISLQLVGPSVLAAHGNKAARSSKGSGRSIAQATGDAQQDMMTGAQRVDSALGGVGITVAAGSVGGVANILSQRAAGPIRFHVAASSRSPAFGVEARSTHDLSESDKGVRIAFAAYTPDFSRRLVMRSVDLGNDPNAGESRLRLEQTMNSMAHEVQASLGGVGLNILESLIPSAHAAGGIELVMAVIGGTAIGIIVGMYGLATVALEGFARAAGGRGHGNVTVVIFGLGCLALSVASFAYVIHSLYTGDAGFSIRITTD